MVNMKPLIDQTFCSFIPFFFLLEVDIFPWYKEPHDSIGSGKQIEHFPLTTQRSVARILLFILTKQGIFFTFDTNQKQFKFPLLFAVIDFWGRGNILLLHEVLSLLRFVEAQSIYIKVCFRGIWGKRNLPIQLWNCNLIPTDYQWWQIQCTWPFPSWS